MKVLLGVLAVLLIAPSNAHAGEHPRDTRLALQVAVAVDYWAGYGVTGCPAGVQAAFFDDLRTDDGTGGVLGQASDCAIWIDSASARAFRRGALRWLRVVRGEDECKLVIHEVGHALGLPHTEAGIMMEDFQDVPAPIECHRWARQYIPRPARLGFTLKRSLASVTRR